MKIHIFKSLSMSVLCGIYAFSAHSATSLFSDYGQIQNVQNYSSNPFWNPNSPYNQKLPQPVYVQGTGVTTEECTNVVKSLVAVQCMARNHCKNASLSDIRPEIMVQLSKLPNKNYASSCAGFIDSAFESYVNEYAGQIVDFPKATAKNTNAVNSNTIQIKNPYKQTTTKWQQEIKDKKAELQELQKQNGAGTEHLVATEFPATYEDLSFTSKMQLMSDGYAPYAGKSAYVIPDFQNKDEWCKGKGSGTEFCNPEKKTEVVATDPTEPRERRSLSDVAREQKEQHVSVEEFYGYPAGTHMDYNHMAGYEFSQNIAKIGANLLATPDYKIEILSGTSPSCFKPCSNTTEPVFYSRAQYSTMRIRETLTAVNCCAKGNYLAYKMVEPEQERDDENYASIPFSDTFYETDAANIYSFVENFGQPLQISGANLIPLNPLDSNCKTISLKFIDTKKNEYQQITKTFQ